MLFLEFHLILALNIMYPSSAHVETQYQSLQGHYSWVSSLLFLSLSRAPSKILGKVYTLWEPDLLTLKLLQGLEHSIASSLEKRPVFSCYFVDIKGNPDLPENAPRQVVGLDIPRSSGIPK